MAQYTLTQYVRCTQQYLVDRYTVHVTTPQMLQDTPLKFDYTTIIPSHTFMTLQHMYIPHIPN